MTGRTGQSVSSDYEHDGFAVFPGAFDASGFQPVDRAFLEAVGRHTDETFDSMHAPELVAFLDRKRETESSIYDELRDSDALRTIATDPRIGEILTGLAPNHEFAVLGKMILRIDLPNWEHEVAHWHQDHHYVRGNAETPTVWIPLQRVDSENGCLLVQPGSHADGAVPHDERIGKRHVPSSEVISGFEPREVPMDVGDVLVFHPLLFHSGQVNRSPGIRFSLNFRYTPVGLPTDPEMGEPIPLAGEAR